MGSFLWVNLIWAARLANTQHAVWRHVRWPVKGALGTIEPRIRTWGKWGVTSEDAFAYAIIVEHTMIDREFFTPFADDSRGAVEIMAEVKHQTDRHLRRVHAAAKWFRLPWWLRLARRSLGQVPVLA